MTPTSHELRSIEDPVMFDQSVIDKTRPPDALRRVPGLDKPSC